MSTCFPRTIALVSLTGQKKPRVGRHRRRQTDKTWVQIPQDSAQHFSSDLPGPPLPSHRTRLPCSLNPCRPTQSNTPIGYRPPGNPPTDWPAAQFFSPAERAVSTLPPAHRAPRALPNWCAPGCCTSHSDGQPVAVMCLLPAGGWAGWCAGCWQEQERGRERVDRGKMGVTVLLLLAEVPRQGSAYPFLPSSPSSSTTPQSPNTRSGESVSMQLCFTCSM